MTNGQDAGDGKHTIESPGENSADSPAHTVAAPIPDLLAAIEGMTKRLDKNFRMVRTVSRKVDRLTESVERILARGQQQDASAAGVVADRGVDEEDADEDPDDELLSNLVAHPRSTPVPAGSTDEDGSDSDAPAPRNAPAASTPALGKRKAAPASNGRKTPANGRLAGKKGAAAVAASAAIPAGAAPYGLTTTGRARKKPGPKPGPKRGRINARPSPANKQAESRNTKGINEGPSAGDEETAGDADDSQVLPPLEPDFSDIATIELDAVTVEALEKVLRQSRMGAGMWFYRSTGKNVKDDGKKRMYLQAVYNRLKRKDGGEGYKTVGEVFQSMMVLYESFMDHAELSGNAWIYKYRKMPEYIEEVRSRAKTSGSLAHDPSETGTDGASQAKDEVKTEVQASKTEPKEEESAVVKEEKSETKEEAEPAPEGEKSEEKLSEDMKREESSENQSTSDKPYSSDTPATVQKDEMKKKTVSDARTGGELSEAPEEDSEEEEVDDENAEDEEEEEEDGEEDSEREVQQPAKRARKAKKMSIE